MRKNVFLVGILALLCACDKHDPILPGERSAIFDTTNIQLLNTSVPDLPENIEQGSVADCPYRLDRENTIWDGERKIFSGFATGNSVDGDRKPFCNDGFVYAGLTTGELVKINPKNRQIVWIADIYRASNMTGGASVLDIVAPIVFDKNYVYVGGLGKAFCKLQDKNGTKVWCLELGIEKPFLVLGSTAFVLDSDKKLSAIRLKDGAVYWQTSVKKSSAPKYEDKTIIVGRERFNAETGEKIK